MRKATTPCVDSDACTPPEFLGFGGAAARRRGLVAHLGGEPRGPLDDDRLLGDPRRLGVVLADPDVEPLDDGAEQRLEARHARFRDRFADAVVGPVPEPDQQRAGQHRRGVAPGLGLDQIGDDVRDRVGRRLGIADTDVEDRHLLRRAARASTSPRSSSAARRRHRFRRRSPLHAPPILPAHLEQRVGDLTERADAHGVDELGEHVAVRDDHLLQPRERRRRLRRVPRMEVGEPRELGLLLVCPSSARA